MSNEVMPNFFTDTFSFTINNKSATIYATQALVEVDSYSTLKIVSGKLEISGGVSAEGIIVKNTGNLAVKCKLDSTGDFFKNATDEFTIMPDKTILYNFKNGLIPSFELTPSQDSFNLTLLSKIKLNEFPVTTATEPSVNSNFISNNQIFNTIRTTPSDEYLKSINGYSIEYVNNDKVINVISNGKISNDYQEITFLEPISDSATTYFNTNSTTIIDNTNKISYDLENLNIAAGAHEIKVIAQANEFKDSNPSDIINFNKFTKTIVTNKRENIFPGDSWQYIITVFPNSSLKIDYDKSNSIFNYINIKIEELSDDQNIIYDGSVSQFPFASIISTVENINVTISLNSNLPIQYQKMEDSFLLSSYDLITYQQKEYSFKFLTGEMCINLNDGKPLIQEHEFLFMPGICCIKDFWIQNDSSWNVECGFYLSEIKGNFDGLLITLKDNDNIIIYSGKVIEFTKDNISYYNKTINMGQRIRLSATFELPAETGSTYKNTNISFVLNCKALPIKNCLYQNPDVAFYDIDSTDKNSIISWFYSEPTSEVKEVWKLNNTLTSDSLSYDVSSDNNLNYEKNIFCSVHHYIKMIAKDGILKYICWESDTFGHIECVVYKDGKWVNEEYRTIKFLENITDENLLAWLAKNAIKEA